MIRTLIGIEDPLARFGLTSLFNHVDGISVVNDVENLEQLIVESVAARPDIVVMDVSSIAQGSTATERILASSGYDGPRIILLTDSLESEHVAHAVRTGIAGLLCRETTPEEMIHAVHAVSAGNVILPRQLASGLSENGGPDTRDPTEGRDSMIDKLTRREEEIFWMAVKGLSNPEIASHMGVSQATVKTHLHRLMSKLSLSSRAQTIVFAYETGLLVPRYLRGRRVVARRDPHVEYDLFRRTDRPGRQ
ncbi:response regulator transcription factor [Actinomadura sp. 7K534]|uniref:LuxR C-terminal-related transcriptional regulator n=1 Tax=Actinomadura sp. 7K534 TaxID=2530366 RepID=UPI001404E021|nr:response regulator transcription factor [Actinomadura sp. 7K534]